ncbi:hypothetical protein Tco_0756560 [Tanacetum coccineum]
MIIKKDSEIVTAKVKRKYLALKAKKESSDEECSTSGNISKKRDVQERLKVIEMLYCGAPDLLIGECQNQRKTINQIAFVEALEWIAVMKIMRRSKTKVSCKLKHQLKDEALKLTKFEKITHCLNEMLNYQKPSGDKLGLGFNSFEASSSGTKETKFVKSHKKAPSDGGPINMGGPLNMQVAPKAIMRPPPAATLGSEKSV